MSYGDGFPQGAMNQAGLAFDGLTIYKPNLKIDPATKAIPYFAAFVREIMQTCQTVEEVKRYARHYNRDIIRNGELFLPINGGIISLWNRTRCCWAPMRNTSLPTFAPQ